MGNNKLNSQETPFFAGDELSLGLMFDSHPAIMLLIDPETGVILEANPAAVSFYGYPKVKLIGMPVAEINNLSDGQLAVEREKAKNEGRNYLVMTQRLANGQARIVEQLSSSFVWQHKQVLFIIIHVIHERLQQPANELNLVLQEEVRRREATFEDLRIHKIELEMQNEELRRSQAELNRPRARFFDLYDLAPVGYCTVNAEDFVLETNLETASLLGVTRVDILKKPFHRFIHSEQQLPYFHFRRQLFETGQPQSLDVQLLKKDGSAFWAHLEATSGLDILEDPKRDAEKPITAKIVISDISERKRTEQTLRENRLQLAFQIAEKEKRAAELEIANQELVFQNAEKAKRAAELEIANQELAFQNAEKAKRAAELVIANQELAFQNVEKAKRAAELEIANQELVFQNEEKIKRAAELIIAKEFAFKSEEKAKQAPELALVNSYLENLINYANAPIIVWDPQFRITRFNHAFEFLTGRSESDVLGQSLEILFPPALAENSMAQIRKTSIGERWESVEIDILHRDGSVRTVLWNSATLFEPDGQTSLATIAQGQDITERKRVEQELLLSELDLKEAQSIAHIGSWKWDLNIGEVTWSDEMFRIFGIDKNSYTGRLGSAVQNAMHPDDLYIVMPDNAANIANLPFEYRIIRPDGAIRLIWAKAANTIFDQDGKPTLLFGVAQDITERKQAERALLEVHQQMESIIESTRAGTWIWNIQTGETIFNETWAQIIGYSLDELVPTTIKTWEMLTHPDDLKQSNELLKRHLESKLPNYDCELRVKHKDGHWVWIHDYGRVFTRTDDGKPLLMFGTSTDITERKQAVEALRISELRYRTQFDQASDGILQLSTNGEVLNLNEAFARMHGYSVEEMQGVGIKNLNPSEPVQLTTERIRRVLAGEMLEFEVEHYHKDGHLFPLAVSTGLVSIDGDLVIQAFHRDITERKRIEQALEKTNLELKLAFTDRDILVEDLRGYQIELEFHNGELRRTQAELESVRDRYVDLYDLAPVGYCTVNETGLIREINLTAVSMLGVSRRLLIKSSFNRYISDEHKNNFNLAKQKLIATREPQAIDLQMVKKDGALFWVHLQVTFEQFNTASPTIRVAISDISLRKQAEDQLKSTNEQLQLRVTEVEELQEELREQAIRDPLTGLYNRRYLNETMEREIARARREKDVFSVIISDIDNFKMINDNYGHQVGDKFLVEIANVLGKHTRGSDIACRYGGEEFLLVLPGIGSDSAVKRAEEIRQRCQEFIIQYKGQALSLTMSFGVACYPDHGQAADEIITKADNAMYHSKNTGRNRVTAWARDESPEALKMVQ